MVFMIGSVRKREKRREWKKFVYLVLSTCPQKTRIEEVFFLNHGIKEVWVSSSTTWIGSHL